ncbi:hypothetical protein PILCRDRAFT_68581 [Piloderma croceum F 1598]|uniref:Tafazzin family protein n=1 Tax=Piloderma croceum (strain F 1598) TaxID=765440 RepID=A0A0C3G053_PILCF|nr:hypothetical protein PILCRDRAFT_68581 [Piloderma croceum F 1598]
MTGLLSTPTVVAVSLICKAFLNSPFCSVTVNGLPALMEALHSEQRQRGRGIVTVSNHISVLDDPIAWGVLPTRLHWSSRTTRWALGASDIMFTNPAFSAFFRAGQVLETFRGRGVYQPAVDTAIEKLNQGQWVHLFGEGKVNQQHGFKKDDNVTRLPRFKWGIGRILMETALPPIIIPMWLTGFDKLMPEHRPFPWKYIPRLGVKLSITFGDPLSPEDIHTVLRTLMRERMTREFNSTDTSRRREIDRVRSVVTAIVQQSVENVGRRVSGDTLGKNIDR